jgi:hypothetical protein
MSIGLGFVKNVDKNWRKHIQSLDRLNEERKDENVDAFLEFKDNIMLNNYKDTNEEFDFWSYWKKNIQL